MKINPETYPHSWMGQNSTIGNLRIDELILPGSHDSGMDKNSPNTNILSEITQDVSAIEQIQGGIRVLDLRVWFYENYPVGDPRRFQLFHLNSSGRTVTTDILEALDRFYLGMITPNDTRREIVILNFHQLENFNYEAHRELQELITLRLGHRLITYDLKDKPLIYLWLSHPGKTVVVSYNWGIDGYTFWNGVNQRWSGKNLNTTTQLKVFMDQVSLEKKPDHELRSIQCAKYVLPFFVPDDFSDKIDEWFKSEDENSYIQKFFIINTDWSLRSDIVRNCIHASCVKALIK
ncbi:hypothetical protein NVV94_17585 [Pseudomonas sp. LS1212]|uniref:hypothetical protein n=1 Tax=Pseudomonas sp. LS1212 TaxID=2972478 RepID=UPI00215C2AD6|nr:hypothetical protein [Pseudomonas sp. LS1212]UVJ42436.1 hypothetical protein NVV94_17585 [Pseudomonas sp. LS1212]